VRFYSPFESQNPSARIIAMDTDHVTYIASALALLVGREGLQTVLQVRAIEEYHAIMITSELYMYLI